MGLNLAIYSTYCGPTKDVTFTDHRYGCYPSFFFTNNPEMLFRAGRAGWQGLFLGDLPLSDDPVVSATQAKLVKAAPHLFAELQPFDFTFYVDDKHILDESRVERVVAKLVADNSPLAIRRHPCPPPNVLYEYSVSLEQPRYYQQRGMMIDYITAQLAQGLSVTAANRYWTSAILRNMRHADTATINAMWLDHINQCGIQCQVSFFFVAQHFPNITLLPDNMALPPELLGK